MIATLLVCLLGSLYCWLLLEIFLGLSTVYPLRSQELIDWRPLELLRLNNYSFKDLMLVSVNEGGIAVSLKWLKKGVYLPFAEMNYHARKSELEDHYLTMHKAPEIRIYLGEKYDLKARFMTKSAVPAGSAGL
jgi:hypothetical protein